MADSTQPIIDQINKVSNFLIVLPPSANGDSIAAALALRAFLRKIDKETTIVSPTSIDPRYSFLDGFLEIQTNIALAKNFVIEVSTKKTAVEELSYRNEENKLLIYLKPKDGELQESDISFKAADFPFGMVITIGVASLDKLGDLYRQNTDLFFQTPVVNIDYRASNESFGQFNLISVNTTSSSEVVMDLISDYEASLIDESIATSLLAGIIIETNSFQHTRTTPQTFLKASQLVSIGARQQEIISQIYRSKSLNFLKLWGRSLAKLKQDNETGLVYTTVSAGDVEQSQATDADVEMIISEMAIQLKTAKFFMVIQEIGQLIRVFVQHPASVNPQLLLNGYQLTSSGPHTVKFTADININDVEGRLISPIIQEIKKLNI